MAILFQESKTKENLMKAFAGESQARNRYTFAAEMADKQDMQAIAEVFRFTAEQERGHAERFYDLLKSQSGQTIEITGGFPIDNHDDIEKSLEAAIHNEMEEYQDIYQEFGNVAKKEGFSEIAATFYMIADVERIHARRFGELLRMLKDGSMYRKKEGAWMCLNCGYIYEGDQLPNVCPACKHDKGYFIPINLAPFTDESMVRIQ